MKRSILKISMYNSQKKIFHVILFKFYYIDGIILFKNVFKPFGTSQSNITREQPSGYFFLNVPSDS